MNFLIREPDAGNLHVRFDERDVKTNPPQETASLLDSAPYIRSCKLVYTHRREFGRFSLSDVKGDG